MQLAPQQIALQKENRGQTVHRTFTPGAGADPLFTQTAFGLDGSETFIPELNREAGPGSQAIREVPDPSRLAALSPREGLWMANEQESDSSFPGHELEPLDVIADIGSLHGGKPLRGQPKGIGYSQPDPPGAHVKGEYPSRLASRR